MVRSYFIDFTDMNFAAAIDNAIYSDDLDKFYKEKNFDMVNQNNLVDLTQEMTDMCKRGRTEIGK